VAAVYQNELRVFWEMSLEILTSPAFWYTFLQVGVVIAFGITALRAWQHSRARFVELVTAFLFGLLLEQGDIFLFGTYRYNENWFLLGDVPVAIALTWALILAGAMNITDALGIRNASEPPSASPLREKFAWLVRGLPAPIADAVWAIVLDLALDAVAIRLGLWTWTIRADEGWFGVPWGNFFAWLFVAFWFSFFTRLVRTQRIFPKLAQWFVPLFAFGGLLATLVPFVAIENTAALPFVADEGQAYHNQVWLVFAIVLAVFVAVTWWALSQPRVSREPADHWLLLLRLVIHGLFLLALIVSGIYLAIPLLLVVALGMLAVELALSWHWRKELILLLHSFSLLRRNNTAAREH
jgi:Carotenoid biosynthesis protein